MFEHVPGLSVANVRVSSRFDGDIVASASHHHAPEPFQVRSELAEGELSIANTPAGERMRLTLNQPIDGLNAVVVIDRAGQSESHVLFPSPLNLTVFESASAPAEPHDFTARLILSASGKEDVQTFRMTEPAGHMH